MHLLINLGLLQVALSIAAIIENIAIEVKSSINETEFEGILARDVESSHFTKRFIIDDEDWCEGKIQGADLGFYTPASAVCNWAFDRSYKVLCQAVNEQAVWVQAYCDVGTYCQQLENAPMWNGETGYDVACKPSKSLVKWAIGSRQTGQSYTEYCSTKNRFDSDRTRTAVYTLMESFFGELGQQTQILYAKILLNGKNIQDGANTNQIAATHALAPEDTIQFCGEAGSPALIEGYGVATFVSWA